MKPDGGVVRRLALVAFIVVSSMSSVFSQTGDDRVTISVTGGKEPSFSWTPEKQIARLVVWAWQSKEQLWETETEGMNHLRPPVRYGIHPAGAASRDQAVPLKVGSKYVVSLFRRERGAPEEFRVVGSLEFTVSDESMEEETLATEDFQGERLPDAAPDVQRQEEEEPDAGERPALRIGALSEQFEFDGILADAAWLNAPDSISNLVTLEPEEGAVPEGRTVIKVLANQHEIVVGARCYDSDPGSIVSYSKARDSELEEEDHIVIVFDTFQDGRSGYVFAVNPTGARFDGLVIEQGEDVNSNWDMIWEAKTSTDELGWSAEIRIPVKSLSFGKDLSDWSFNVQRRVQRIQETSRWSSAKRDFEIYQTSRAGLLTNLPEFDLGVGLTIRPSLVGSLRKPSRSAPTDTDGDLSVDISQKLGSNILSSLTINTDFAETEVDVRQVNLTRFPLFFPEKRTFFLEGADIFDFGLGLDEDNLLPFFSRRIGLFGLSEDDQFEIPINVGGKVNGRIEDTNFGVLVVNTRQVDSIAISDEEKLHVPQTSMGVIRVKQNVLEESSVGVLATFGDQLARTKSWSAGVDFTFRTSSFLEDKTLLVGLWGMLNDRADLQGDKSTFGFRVDYPNDLFDVNVTSIRIGDGFDPSLGFVPRRGIHLWDFTGDFKPRPSWELVRQMTHELSFRLFNNRSNSSWESYTLLVKPLDWLFESGDRFAAGIIAEGDRPPEDFELATDVDIQAGSYSWRRYFLEARSAEKRPVSSQLRWESGSYYSGNLNTLELRLTFKPSAFVTLELTGERNTGTVLALPDFEDEPILLVQKNFLEEVFGFGIQLNVSSDLQFSSLTQYDTQSKELGSNNKVRWTFDPLGELFVVYNHSLIRTTENRWQFVSSQLPVKIQYTFRF